MTARALRRWSILLGGLVLLVAGLIGLYVAFQSLAPTPEPPVSLARPAPGQAKATFLPDGAPVWAISHDDGSVSVLSGFDTHTPLGIGKLLWWCPAGRLLENPHTGSSFDEFGVKLGGPAPAGLPSWQVQLRSGRVLLGDRVPAPPIGTPVLGPGWMERDHCFGNDPVVVHDFNGWRVWDSPSALVAAAPDGWSLIHATLHPVAGGTILCAFSGCDDAVPVPGVEYPPADLLQFYAPWPETEWIVRVDGGRLAGLTRTVRPTDFPFHP